MPLFPVLETETLVQENDKTRLDGSKSYAGGVPVISVTEIAPYAGATALDVSTDGFLDWEFPFAIDIVAGVNNKLDFSEASVEKTATLAAGTYTLAQLATEIQTKMTAAGGTYTVSVSSENVLTIAGLAAFSLLPESGTNAATSILPSIGFEEDADYVAETTFDGEEIERITRTVSLHIENAVTPTADDADKDIEITIISERADKLFSTDAKLKGRETDIMKYLADGRATYKNFHRQAQGLMFAWLDTQGYMDDFAEKLTPARIVDIEEVSEWATMVCLRLIFDSISNATDDNFFKKARQYEKMEGFYRDKAILRIDLNQDGVADLGEVLDVQHARVVRR